MQCGPTVAAAGWAPLRNPSFLGELSITRWGRVSTGEPPVSGCFSLTSPPRPATTQLGGAPWALSSTRRARATTLPAHRRDGFHAGVLGIAWAAVRAAILLEEEELHARAVALLPRLGGRYRCEQCPDLISGMAGSVLGLLALASELDDRRLAEQACATGDMLIRRATVTSRGWSWASPGRRYPAHLCGVSHGAAGIGWALLELFAATGDDRFRAGATGAFCI